MRYRRCLPSEDTRMPGSHASWHCRQPGLCPGFVHDRWDSPLRRGLPKSLPGAKLQLLLTQISRLCRFTTMSARARLSVLVAFFLALCAQSAVAQCIAGYLCLVSWSALLVVLPHYASRPPTTNITHSFIFRTGANGTVCAPCSAGHVFPHWHIPSALSHPLSFTLKHFSFSHFRSLALSLFHTFPPVRPFFHAIQLLTQI